MAGDLDQLSVEIGKLQAQAADTRSATEAIWRKLEDIGDKLAPLPGLVIDMRSVKDKVESHERWKNRVLGLASGVSVVAGAAGSFLAQKLGLK